MDIPDFKKLAKPITYEESINQLLYSIAKEEQALSALIEAESKKIEAFIGLDRNFPSQPSSEQFIDFNYSINQLMDTIFMKEWLLLKKFEKLLHIKKKFENKEQECLPLEEEEEE